MKSDCQVGPKIGQNEVLAQKDKLQKIINGWGSINEWH